jgi:hypothetical protein
MANHTVAALDDDTRYSTPAEIDGERETDRTTACDQNTGFRHGCVAMQGS